MPNGISSDVTDGFAYNLGYNFKIQPVIRILPDIDRFLKIL